MSDTGGRSIADIAARHRRSSEPFEFEIEGEKLTAIRLASAAELIGLEKQATLMIQVSETNPNPQWLPWRPYDAQTVRMATYVSKLLVSPACTMADALMLAHEAGGWFLQVAARLMEEIGLAASETEEAAIDEEGEPSSAEDGGGSTPSSLGTSTTEDSRN